MLKRNILLNETGQMAVFVALIFQVLFVLFAMVINIGLIVHDKINLQNSVDLAAYYAASKQAESMNMIAHINYQMRQDYKLLAWRYRVLGSFGTNEPQQHPATTDPLSASLTDTPYSAGEPSVCIGHMGWNESYANDKDGNKCKSSNLKIPDLKPISYIPLSPPFNISVVSQFARARETIGASCDMISPYNWGFATLMISSYRIAMSERKKQILKISSELSKSEDFLDSSGESVRQGALKTLEKNLTASNRAPGSFDANDAGAFEFINGLSLGGCEQPDQVGFPKWLVDIQIAPIVFYTELKRVGSSAQCDAQVKPYDSPPSANTAAAFGPLYSQLAGMAGEFQSNNILRSSRGFEKNPWCLAYVGIKAKTKPRKPFAPFGKPIQMEAKAFAEPFGGRIGPWNGKRWAAQAERSEDNDPTDPLAVPRGEFDPKYRYLYLPNYSRYPGDTLGLKSKLALGLMRDSIAPAFGKRDPRLKFSYVDYGNPADVAKNGDPLAWNTSSNYSVSRLLEIAAVAPDLFDMTYYSVDPNYFSNFFNRAKEKFFSGIAPIGDIGSRFEETALKEIGIRAQIAEVAKHADAKDAFYLTKKWEHLLTGWVQGGVVDYTSRSLAVAERFGECQSSPSPRQPAVPGSCIAGGRVGYSVRLVHKEYLFSEHELGGKGSGKDRIKNLPPSSF